MIRNQVQTNGLLLSSEIIELCADYNVGLSISLDGPQEIHDAFRVDHARKPSQGRVVSAIERLRKHPKAAELFSAILAVIDPRSNLRFRPSNRALDTR